MELENTALQPKDEPVDACTVLPADPTLARLVLENNLVFGALLQALLRAVEQKP